jgi:O-antigen/teichoic acid export membrane protein
LAGFSGSVGAIGLIAAFAFGPWLIQFIYGPEFARNDMFFSQMMAFAMVAYLSTCVGNLATATGKFRGFAVGYGVVTLLSAILSFKLIPVMGISGAILTAALISLLNGIMAYGFYRRWRRSLEPLA